MPEGLTDRLDAPAGFGAEPQTAKQEVFSRKLPSAEPKQSAILKNSHKNLQKILVLLVDL